MFSLILSFAILLPYCICNDITNQVFGKSIEGIIAAFGDFNSDELTDVFILKNNAKTVEILLGHDTEPLLRAGYNCTFENREITSVIPGDFDGDALMDVMVTLKSARKDSLDVLVNWGGTDHLNCTSEILLNTIGEPLVIDFNGDMILDLYGENDKGERCFWVFSDDRQKPQMIIQTDPNTKNFKNSSLTNRTPSLARLQIPHANAFLDLNKDYMADLFVQTVDHFEIWTGRTNELEDFDYHKKIELKLVGNDDYILGQSLFLDMELKGDQNLVLPVCFDKMCKNSTILVYENDHFWDLHVNFKDTQGNIWGFIPRSDDNPYSKVITARSGDFNMDGYPDLLVTLQTLSNEKRFQTFLLENVHCKVCNKPLKRTFEIQWYAIPLGNNTIAGTFYDFYQDGVLDVILIEKKGHTYRPLAFRNTLDYDANFVKVIVLTGLMNKNNSTAITPLGRKKRTYGTNLPGPRIEYYTITQEGDNQHGASSQLPQSAYFALQLPYTIFGLGRTPNFVDSLTVGLNNNSRTWTQLIPNSQMIVIPRPIRDPGQWKAQLFVTPSKLILMSVVALGGTCLVIMIIILGLYIKEKREDKKEKLMEANRFHFDAM
ncbi:T-cell immunomodulatory protein [Condylostylus longicornis]|uniref:T-cell immunomodulatory protein n=1 Tax=Condylostylus longicornis TaxID=2530218 RepID=UPI00244E4398|nr:T-cell immunomodulatory protein [Condylostylus longicornis]